MVFASNRKWLRHSDFPSYQGKNVAFNMTYDCNLRCTYCYVSNKSRKDMDFSTAVRIIDEMFDKPQEYLCAPVIGRSSTSAEETQPARPAERVVFEFIGGEPLLRIEIIDRVCDYIKYKAVKTNLCSCFKFMISTNGVRYGNKDVQQFIRKNKNLLSVGISLDGTKRMHDSCRIFPNGTGSFNAVVANVPKWRSQFPQATTKLTISPQNLHWLSESILYLWRKVGLQYVPANVVFEDVWRKQDEYEYRSQLTHLAEFLQHDDNSLRYSTSLLDEEVGHPIPTQDIGMPCGGNGKMLFWDTDGSLYNCSRFAPGSCGDGIGFPIGGLSVGWNDDNYARLRGITRRSCSSDECFECAIASGCNFCPGFQYDVFGDPGRRATFICGMHKTRSRVCQEYFDVLSSRPLADYNHAVFWTQEKERYLTNLSNIMNRCDILRSTLESCSRHYDLDWNSMIDEYYDLRHYLLSELETLYKKYEIGRGHYVFDFLHKYFIDKDAFAAGPSSFVFHSR